MNPNYKGNGSKPGERRPGGTTSRRWELDDHGKAEKLLGCGLNRCRSTSDFPKTKMAPRVQPRGRGGER